MSRTLSDVNLSQTDVCIQQLTKLLSTEWCLHHKIREQAKLNLENTSRLRNICASLLHVTENKFHLSFKIKRPIYFVI